MGKKDKNKKKGKGAEKTAMKTEKKTERKQKKLLEKIGEANIEDMIATLNAEQARLNQVTETICPSPSPRSSFSMISHPEKDEIIIFGGEFFNGQNISVYNDLYFYNVTKKEWKLVKSPNGPAPRSAHQMVSLPANGGQLWLFGGEYASPSQLQFYHYKDLWCFQLTTKKWEKIIAPNAPSPRSGHRMIAFKKKLIVFGGFHDNNQSYRYFNDVHMFSLENYDWMKIEIGGAIIPQPRSGCCLAGAPDGKILIWGGYSKSQVKKDVDLGVTHTDMFALVPDKSNPNDKFKWTTVKPSGYKPQPRSSVGYTISPNKVYCFGGVMDVDENEEEVKGQCANELYFLDLTTLTWRFADIQSKQKHENIESTLKDVEMTTNVENKKVVTTESGFTLSFSSTSNSQPFQSTSNIKAESNLKLLPSPRMNAGLCVVKKHLYLFGGIYEDENNKQVTFNDLYSIDINKLDKWTNIGETQAHDWLGESDDNSSSEGSDNDESSTESDSDSEMDTE